MKTRIIVASMIVCALLCQAAAGYNPPFDPNMPGGRVTVNGYQFTWDYYYNPADGYYWGDANAHDFEIWEVGARMKDGKLEFSIWMNLPETGAQTVDTYSGGVPVDLSPGDLWITVGSPDPFSTKAGVVRHAIALTDHANVVPQKYHQGGVPDVWPQVTKGRLYKNAEFSTGTFETYQEFMESNDFWYYPNDQDGRNDLNSYMALIKGFDEEVTGVSSVLWTQEDYWDDDAGDWVEAWRVTGDVELAAVGLDDPSMRYAFSLFLSSECGNDGAEHHNVPEPGVLTLLALAIGIKRLRRRM